MVLPPQEAELHIQQIRHDRRMMLIALSWGVVFSLLGHQILNRAIHLAFPTSYILRKAVDGCLFLTGISASMLISSRISANWRIFYYYASILSLVILVLCILAQFSFPYL